MDIWTLLILACLIGGWALQVLVTLLDLRHGSRSLPAEFADIWDQAGYAKALAYSRDRARLGLLSGTVSLLLTLAVIFGGVLNGWDQLLRAHIGAELPRGIAFWIGIVLASGAVSLPFGIYRTFVIEARYGFNRSSARQYVQDLALGLLLAGVLGIPVLALLLWLFAALGDTAWLWAWGAMVAYQFLVSFLAPKFIMPLFNKFEPLAEGELRDAIEQYARDQHFALGGVYTMDGSKRSAKANAFFTGFGGMRRIVLFDTLVQQHTVRELLAVLAHEMGHYKLGHIWKGFALGIGVNGLLFVVLNLLIGEPAVATAFRMEATSVYASLVFVGVLIAPLSLVIGALQNGLSRRYEYQADRYAADTLPDGAPSLISGLKRLCANNLADLEPHPLDVFLNHSHPPVLQRIAALRAHAAGTAPDSTDTAGETR